MKFSLISPTSTKVSLTDAVSLPLNVSVSPMAMGAIVRLCFGLIERMSSYIAASVVKTTLQGLRRCDSKVVAAPNLVALNVKLQNGAGRSDAAWYTLALVLCNEQPT